MRSSIESISARSMFADELVLFVYVRWMRIEEDYLKTKAWLSLLMFVDRERISLN